MSNLEVFSLLGYVTVWTVANGKSRHNASFGKRPPQGVEEAETKV